MEAADFEIDLDLAFELQMHEALVASIALQPTSSSSALKSPSLIGISQSIPGSSSQSLKSDKVHQELKNRQQYETEINRIVEDVLRRFHDDGDAIERPFGEGSSSSATVPVNRQPHRLYFKGLFDAPTSAIGVAICDHRDNLIQKIQKTLKGDLGNHREVELMGLVEGLNVAVALGIKRIILFCVNGTIFQQITGRWQVKQRRIATLVNQVFQLQRKFETCRPILVPRNDLKYAFRFARDAIDSQVTKQVVVDSSPTKNKNLKESCTICLEDTDAKEMFIIGGCLHQYCFSCMKQHMEVKILQGVIPGCPHGGCKTTLTLDGSKNFLPPKLAERMSLLIKEAAVPVTEKIYCPYPKCSTLMSKREAADRSVVRKCVKCHGLFCINCKVPWHSTMNCNEFKRSNISARIEEAKLKKLAHQNLWRQCVKCNHMIELAEGCYHMTCRCGYEFCYTCGAEWKNKRQTCRCKLWDERNIMHDYDTDDEDDFDEEDDYADFGHEEENFIRGWQYYKFSPYFLLFLVVLAILAHQ